jgi:hypothetical protein
VTGFLESREPARERLSPARRERALAVLAEPAFDSRWVVGQPQRFFCVPQDHVRLGMNLAGDVAKSLRACRPDAAVARSCTPCARLRQPGPRSWSGVTPREAASRVVRRDGVAMLATVARRPTSRAHRRRPVDGTRRRPSAAGPATVAAGQSDAEWRKRSRDWCIPRAGDAGAPSVVRHSTVGARRGDGDPGADVAASGIGAVRACHTGARDGADPRRQGHRGDDQERAAAAGRQAA